MKKCIYCGKELPQDASWCPYCEKTQTEPEKVRLPGRHRKILISCFLLVAIIGAVAIWMLNRPHAAKVYEGGEQISYKLNGRDCTVLLSFKNDALTTGKSQAELTDTIMEGNDSAIPAQLFVYSKDDPGIQDAFINEAESCSVTAQPEGQAEKVDVFGPDPGSEVGFAGAWVADIIYSPRTGTNRICWEVQMKNGDVLRLSQTVTCNKRKVITYHYDDTPMETIDEINALIQKTAQEAPDALLQLYLPPVTYEGNLVMEERTATLFGSEKDGQKTTFTGSLQVGTRIPDIAEIYDLEFTGNGGTAVSAQEALRVRTCTFTGWDVGIDIQDGSWVNVKNSAFVGNGTGMRFTSKHSSYADPTYENVVFKDNTLGMQILQVPGDYSLNFINPVFEGNETDYEDPKGYVNIQ